MFLQGKSERGSRVAVRPEKISAVRDKGNRCCVCVDGQWVYLDMTFVELVTRLEQDSD